MSTNQGSCGQDVDEIGVEEIAKFAKKKPNQQTPTMPSTIELEELAHPTNGRLLLDTSVHTRHRRQLLLVVAVAVVACSAISAVAAGVAYSFGDAHKVAAAATPNVASSDTSQIPPSQVDAYLERLDPRDIRDRVTLLNNFTIAPTTPKPLVQVVHVRTNHASRGVLGSAIEAIGETFWTVRYVIVACVRRCA